MFKKCLFALISIVSITFIIIIFLNEDTTTLQQSTQKKIEEVPLKLEVGHLHQYQNNVLFSSIQSEQIEYFVTKNVVYFKQLKGYISSEKEGSFYVSSEKARMNLQSKDIYLEGNVNIENNEGTQFISEQIDYSSEQNMLSSLEAIKIKFKNSTLIGTSFEYNLEKKQLNIKNPELEYTGL